MKNSTSSNSHQDPLHFSRTSSYGTLPGSFESYGTWLVNREKQEVLRNGTLHGLAIDDKGLQLEEEEAERQNLRKYLFHRNNAIEGNGHSQVLKTTRAQELKAIRYVRASPKLYVDGFI